MKTHPLKSTRNLVGTCCVSREFDIQFSSNNIGAAAVDNYMKYFCYWMAAALSLTALETRVVHGAEAVTAAKESKPFAFVCESDYEFVSGGDFDGDGRSDVVIVDKLTGKFRLGYQLTSGTYSWMNVRLSGIDHVAGITVGKLISASRDAVALAAPDANRVAIFDVSKLATMEPPVAVSPQALGPNTLVAIDIGGAGNTAHQDLYVSTMYNDPTPNHVTLMRNDGVGFSDLSDTPVTGEVGRGNRVCLKAGGPDLAGVLLSDESSATFRVENLTTGKSATVAEAAGIPAKSAYVVGSFRGLPLREVIFYKPGESNLLAYPVEEPVPGKFQFGAAHSFNVGQAIQQAFALPATGGDKLLIIFGSGETGGIHSFTGTTAPALLQPVTAAPGEVLFGAIISTDHFLLLSGRAGGKFSSRFQTYKYTGAKYEAGLAGDLATLDETDVAIHARILANLTVTNEAEMKPYTNTIPATQVSYVMMPIPGGEFVMGSPEAEAGRKADEGPQHKVKIAPFWMGRCEITWNEFQLFMYPDEERKFKDTMATDPAVDKISDAVTRPTKPYTEMSFGMGKDGYPAISMTQHAANKYCQWLSAKTGEFYRLPTEAEWEYACRAGSTTAYFYGDDPAKLDEYAWYGKNSDWKYQKAGRKKPNAWGLHDMHGNVIEWTLDQYDPDYYHQLLAGNPAASPWNKSSKPYPHSVRGGSWDDDDPLVLRSAARRGSDRAWKMQDPQLPKSVWYHSDAPFVGFRIVRPLKVPPPEELSKYWTSGVERD